MCVCESFLNAYEVQLRNLHHRKTFLGWIFPFFALIDKISLGLLKMFWKNFSSSMNGMSNVFQNHLELLLNKSIKMTSVYRIFLKMLLI